jgi:peptidoglycan/LPS O-acetylase OafA/YrhL
VRRFEHVPALDGLRGLAILMVVAVHSVQLVPPGLAESFLAKAVVKTASAGWLGVDLFFALSGFLITNLLLDMPRTAPALKNFYGRRALRILPAYALVLAVSLAFRLAVDPGTATRLKVPDPSHHGLMALYVQNLVYLWGGDVTRCGWLTHTWSLAVEEHFYLLWPAVVLALGRNRLRFVVPALVGAILVIRLGAVDQRVPLMAVYTATWFRMDALLLGTAIALFPPLPKAVHLAVIAAFAGFLAHETRAVDRLGLAAPFMQRHGYTLAGLAAASLVGWAAQSVRVFAPILRSAFLRFTGLVSYGIYLVHVPVKIALGPHLRETFGSLPPLLQFVIYFAAILSASFALALISWKILESPCLRLKDRFFPRLPPPVGVSS